MAKGRMRSIEQGMRSELKIKQRMRRESSIAHAHTTDFLINILSVKKLYYQKNVIIFHLNFPSREKGTNLYYLVEDFPPVSFCKNSRW
jgi:hypothetical protein